VAEMAIRSERGRVIRRAVSGNRGFRAILSSNDVALDGHKVNVDGWNLPASGRCPLVDTHRDQAGGIRSVLGSVQDIRVDHAELTDGRTARALCGTLIFAEADVNPDSEVAYQLYSAGYADAVSVSFIPLAWDFARERGRAPGAMDIASAKLLETSVVAVPSDENARVLARAVRAHIAGNETRFDRLVRARAIRDRIRREDVATGHGYLWRR
jgi:hypothetical protein